jgi:hypothetical protein
MLGGGAEEHLVAASGIAHFLTGPGLFGEWQFLLLFLLPADDEVAVEDAATLNLDGLGGYGALAGAVFVDGD